MASTTKGSSSPSAIRFSDRVFLVGETGTGKSHLLRALLLSTSGRRLVLDPGDSDVLDHLPGGVTFHDPKRWPDVGALARFVPPDPLDLDAYDELYRRAFALGRTLVACDEMGLVMPSQAQVPRNAMTYVIAGRKRECGHLGCHTRPVDVSPKATSVVQHVFAFRLPLPEDRRRIGAIAGVEPRTIDQLQPELGEHGFMWVDRRAARVTLCPPLTV
jgi:hypothetical protein